MKTKDSASRNTDETTDPPHPQGLSRRQLLLSGGAAATAFTIVPRHVLGGAGFVAPSEKITLACVGFGTQAIREIGGGPPRPPRPGGGRSGGGEERAP